MKEDRQICMITGMYLDTGQEEDEEKLAQKLAEKSARRRQAKRTEETIEIGSSLLICPSTELLSTFKTILATLMETKISANSLTCFQIVLNSLMALFIREYPDQSEQTSQEMIGSLLHKIFQKSRASASEALGINADANQNGGDDLAKTCCQCELLCLLEMHLLRFSSTTISQQQLNVETSTSLNSRPSTSSGPTGIINFIEKAQKRKNKNVELDVPMPSKPASTEQLTPTQLATKNVVARLRQLYLLYMDPEQFRLFMEDVLCEEFLEELPFYLASIYEQLDMEVPQELGPFTSQECKDQQQRQNQLFGEKKGRKPLLDLRDYTNKRLDLVKQLLEEGMGDGEGEGKENLLMKAKRKKREESRAARVGMGKKKPGLSSGEKGRRKLPTSAMAKRPLMMAPRKQLVQSKAMQMAAKRLGGGSRVGSRNGNYSIEPPAIAAVNSRPEGSPKRAKLLARRRILVPETPEKNIGKKQMGKRAGGSGEEEEVVPQTPFGKDGAGDSSLITSMLSELLIRKFVELERGMELALASCSSSTSFGPSLIPTVNPPPSSTGGHGVKRRPIPFFLAKECEKQQQIGRNVVSERKRPLTPSENVGSAGGGMSVAEMLQMKCQLQQQAKKPCRRLFPSSRSSTSSISFPFTRSDGARKS